MPVAVGVPLMVIVLFAQVALTPAGKPVGELIAVAPVVVCVIEVVNAVLIHNVGVLEAAVTVLAAVTVMIPVAFTLPQPPVKGML
jgi:hypothetical protein